MFHWFKKIDVAVDLGTSKIAIYTRGDGLVIEEPACIAFKGREFSANSVVAIGDEAARMCGRTPRNIHVVKPIQCGVISDYKIAGLLLKKLLARPSLSNLLTRRRRFLVGALSGASSVERRAFEHVALAAGARDVALVSEPLAAAVGAQLPLEEPGACMVVDVGGGASEAMIVSLSRVVNCGSIRIGGDAMNGAIKQALHRRIGLDIGLQEAKRLKEAIGANLDENDSLDTRGLDTRLLRPRHASIRVGDLRSALMPPINAIADMVKGVIRNLPVELAADLTERGITLTGGAGKTYALKEALEQATQVPVRPLDAPQRAVINGCGRMLDQRIVHE